MNPLSRFLPVSLLGVILAGSIGLAIPSQAAENVSKPVVLPTCYSFPANIHAGTQDSSTSSDVDSLQRFLVDQGFFSASNLGTGHFGPITLKAVAAFQAAHAVPATGFVGPLTREAIAKLQPNCGTTAAAKLYSLSPDSGPAGTTINIRGFGFSNSNTILIDGMVAARNVPIASSIAISCTTDPSCHGGINQTLTFTLPSSLSPDCPVGSMCPLYLRLLTPGTTTVTVRNDTAVSNGLTYTVTK